MIAAWLLVACLFRRETERDPLDAALAEADAAWRVRAETDGLRRSEQALLGVLAEWPEEPQVLWRLARQYRTEADTLSGPERERRLDLAREYGMRCLMLDPGFATRVEVAGGRIPVVAVRQLDEADADCLAELAVAWLRWVEHRGPAAALDLEVLDLFARRLDEVEAARWEGAWAMGMVTALHPHDGDPGPDLQRAIEREPALVPIHLDWVRYAVAGEDRRDALRELLALHPPGADGPWRLENEIARDRARAMLESDG